MSQQKMFTNGFLVSLTVLLAAACASHPHNAQTTAGASGSGGTNAATSAATASAAPHSESKAHSSSGSSSYHLRPYEERVLPNGLKLILVQDSSLPYISYSMVVKAGSATDPAEFAGLSSFVAELLETGSAHHTAPQIADELAHLGSEFEASVTSDYTSLEASGLSMDSKALLTLFNEIVTQPAFAEKEIQRVRLETQSHISRRQDNPEGFIDQAWRQYLYGTHPYGQMTQGTLKTIAAIHKKQLIQHYLKYYRPNNSYLSVVGKITPALVQQVSEVFGQWQSRDVPAMTFPEFPPIHGLQTTLINKAGMVQAQIRIGNKGIRRKNPDYIPLRIANNILGGSFIGRLSKRVRIELGLTYDISSGFEAREDYGPFAIETFTKNATVGQTIQETLKTLQLFHDKGVTNEEVERSRGYLKGVFPVAIETAEKLGFNLMILRLYGVPDTYLSNYLQEVDKTTLADVNRVIQKYIDPVDLKILIYGDAHDIQGQLTGLGSVDLKQPSAFE